MDTEGWRGGSGTLYSYTVVELDQQPNVAFGNYIFAKRTPAGGWKAIHVGHGDLSLRTDLARHERRDFILEQGATHVHIRENPSLTSRMVERADILERVELEEEAERELENILENQSPPVVAEGNGVVRACQADRATVRPRLDGAAVPEIAAV